MQSNKKNNILFKNLNLFLVYGIVFGVGILIVFIMTSYLNNKVNEFTNLYLSNAENSN